MEFEMRATKKIQNLSDSELEEISRSILEAMKFMVRENRKRSVILDGVEEIPALSITIGINEY